MIVGGRGSRMLAIRAGGRGSLYSDCRECVLSQVEYESVQREVGRLVKISWARYCLGVN